MTFPNSMAAKEFLVSRIVEEARRRDVSLSEVEKKMLYFSERYETLPDMMEVNEKFDAEYDGEKYEKKIRRLSKKAFQHDRRDFTDNVERWRAAIKMLSREDHYILVMLDVPRSAGDVVKLCVAGIIVTAVGLAAAFALNWAHNNARFRIPDSLSVLIMAGLVVAIIYLSFSPNGKKFGDWIFELFERVCKWF